MSNGMSAFGTLLKKGDGGSPESFATIAEVTNIGGPQLSLDAIELTNHSSTGGWREFVGGLLDAGEVSIEVNFVPTHATHSQSSGLVSDMVNRVVRNFQLVFPDTGSTTWQFAALVTRIEPSEPVDDALKASITLKVSGQPTLAG